VNPNPPGLHGVKEPQDGAVERFGAILGDEDVAVVEDAPFRHRKQLVQSLRQRRWEHFVFCTPYEQGGVVELVESLGGLDRFVRDPNANGVRWLGNRWGVDTRVTLRTCNR